MIISKSSKKLMILNLGSNKIYLERNKIGDSGILRILKNLKDLIEFNTSMGGGM